ncbi:MAG: peptidoglycan editing factor PgeF [Chloroflexi bacterium]|nr:peptidoglycan editing factor PgeF [Chloroflexota bacterium]
MQPHIQNAVKYYSFDSLNHSANIIHAISTRHGGVSPAPFASLNLGKSVGDAPENVAENLDRWLGALNLKRDAAVTASQAQADQVAIIERDQRGTIIPDTDALITRHAGIPLVLRYADCVPILFFDPQTPAIGIAHAGWRGTVAKIATRTVRAMMQHFGSQPRDLIACVGPSIGPCCYRVGGEVIQRARAAFPSDGVLIAQPSSAVHFDLWEANAQQLRELGIEQVEIARLCTSDRTDDFYSHRGENGQTGRFGAVIALA